MAATIILKSLAGHVIGTRTGFNLGLIMLKLGVYKFNFFLSQFVNVNYFFASHVCSYFLSSVHITYYVHIVSRLTPTPKKLGDGMG